MGCCDMAYFQFIISSMSFLGNETALTIPNLLNISRVINYCAQTYSQNNFFYHIKRITIEGDTITLCHGMK